MTNPAQLFEQAVSAFRGGRTDEAEQLCREVMRNVQPNPVCLHLMGVILNRKGQAAESETYLRQALKLKPDTAEIHYNLGIALLVQMKYDEAATAMRQAMILQPVYPAAAYQLGHILQKQNKPAEALAAYEDCLRHAPDYTDALNAIGILLCELGRRREALPYFRRLIELRPDLPEAFNNLGATYIDLDEPEQARLFCEKALALRPDYVSALNNLGNAHRAANLFAEAEDCYRRALALDPTQLKARNNLGLCLMYGAGDLHAAKACFNEVLALQPNDTHALNNRGIVLCQQGLFEEGIASYRKALDIDPGHVDALSNCGSALRATGKPEAALEMYRRAVTLKPDAADAHNNLAMLMLGSGQFTEGFREYEWRWRTSQLRAARRVFSQPQWEGWEISGRTLLIHAEQGFGDTLQFCRYADMAAARGAKIVMEIPQFLTRLVASLKCAPQIVATGEDLPHFDLHCPMMSLPAAFGTQIHNIPHDIPYLFATDSDLAVWQQRVPPSPGIRKIGLVWAGNPRNHSFELSSIDRQRSMNPEHLNALRDASNVAFYSLQKDGLPPPADFPITDLMRECRDFADTAALIMQLDLVISVDTSVVHLAGALGKPTWLLNRYDTCWRWLYDRNDSPWYPALRQFRQTRYGDWNGVMQRVAEALNQAS